MNAFVLKRPVLLALLAAVGLLAVLPLRTFVAEVKASRVARVLDDDRTEHLDVVSITEETIPRYLEAIELLEDAAVWGPTNSRHPRMLADLAAHLADWGETMTSLGQALPDRAVAAGNLRMRADQALATAVAQEPTNPYHHLARAQLFAQGDAAAQAGALERAVSLYPVSSPLRYEVAFQYLLAGDQQKALEHARSLAMNDDSYRLHENNSQLIRQQRSAWYVGHLSNSYLARALEIAWRCGIRSGEDLADIVPDNPDAQDALSFFLEGKGIQ